MSVSIKDIATALNLSKATVSWVLSGQGEAKGFSEATIKQVKQYAAEVNYRPNQLARSLSTGATHTLGLIIPSIGDTFFAQMAQAIEAEAEKQNYVLTICSSRGDGKREMQLIQTLRDKQIDGLIMVPSEKTIKGIGDLLHDNFPFVLVDRHFSQLKTNYIIVDDIDGCYRLTESLIHKGCHKIAYITTDTHLQLMKLRLNGYVKALETNGLSFNKELYVEIDKNNYNNEIDKKIDFLLENITEIDGIVFSTHYLAIGVIRYLIQKKIFYKNQIQIASFHSNTALEVLVPEIAVARIPIEDMGKKAVDILLNNIKDKHAEKEEVVLEIKYERL
ncbi:LacI family DNA-binding transcriptional regulator [Bacteroides sp.]